MFNTILITTYFTAARAAETGAGRIGRVIGNRDEKGQASAEYALVLLGAALLAILLGGWIAQEDTVKQVFTKAISKILGDMPS